MIDIDFAFSLIEIESEREQDSEGGFCLNSTNSHGQLT